MTKNVFILVLPFKEISIYPELSSPTCFKIQVEYPERHKIRTKSEGTEILVSNMEQHQQQYCGIVTSFSLFCRKQWLVFLSTYIFTFCGCRNSLSQSDILQPTFSIKVLQPALHKLIDPYCALLVTKKLIGLDFLLLQILL